MLSTVVRTTLLGNYRIRRTYVDIGRNAAHYWVRIQEKEKNDYVANPLNDQMVASTERWVRDFVGKHNLCPFVNKYSKSIHVLSLRDDASYEEIRLHVIDHLLHLMAKDQTETSTKLLVLPQKRFMDWDNFQLMSGMVKGSALMMGIPGFELVNFHPRIRRGLSPFELFPENSPLHFTARSPYPTLHLFKSADANNEVRRWENRTKMKAHVTEEGRKILPHIFQRNVETLLTLGYQTVNKQFQALYKPPVDDDNGPAVCPVHKREPTADDNGPPVCPVHRKEPTAPIVANAAPAAPVFPTTPPVTFAAPPKRKGPVKKVKTV